jgi:ABC-type transporter Mla subunit MlaD
MSNQLQVISDLKIGLEQLSQRVEAVEATNAQDLAAIISRELEVTRQQLIEGFTGKFAVALLESTNTIKRSVEENRQQLEGAEQQTADLEGKLIAFRAEVSGLLDDAAGRLAGMFESHHARSGASLTTFGEQANAVGVAAMKIAEAAKLCGNFKHDYEQTATQARHSLTFQTETMDGLLAQLRGTVESINQKAEALEARRTRYILFIAGALVIGILFGVLITLLLK